MSLEFSQELREKLMQMDFQAMNDASGQYQTLLKQEHTHLYIINMIYADIDRVLEQGQEWEEKYVQRLRSLFPTLPADRVMVLQLYITEEKGELLYDQLCKAPFEPDRDIYLIPWLIDLEQKKLRVPPNQPKKILHVNRVIEGIFDPDQTNTSIPIPSLQIQSSNIFFTLGLIVINGLLWVLMELAGGSTNHKVLLQFGANEVGRIIYRGEYWRLFTSIFLHIGVMHLLYNNFSLYLFGSRVEKYFGKIKFVIIYFVSGFLGSIASVGMAYYVGNLTTLSAGASGAIYGLLGATFALGRKTQRKIDDLSAYTIGIMIVVGVGIGFIYPNIDNTAHIAGLITGYLLGRRL